MNFSSRKAQANRVSEIEGDSVWELWICPSKHAYKVILSLCAASKRLSKVRWLQ